MKKFFGSLFSSRKKRLLILGVVFLLLIAYAILAMFLVSPGSISLEKLRQSFSEDKICHEACTAQRQADSAILARELAQDSGAKSARRLQTYFLDEAGGVDFRISLVRIIQTAVGPDNPPDYIKDYLSAGNSPLIRAEIIGNFNARALSEESNPLDYYFKILAGDEGMAVKLAAIRALSSLADKENLIKADQLELIKKIIFNSGTDKKLRQPLILLLGDYYPLWPEETENILSALYLTEASGDSISRAFAADILNRSGGEEVAVPAVSAEEWAEYYNN